MYEGVVACASNYMFFWSNKTIRFGAAFALLGFLIQSYVLPGAAGAATAVFYPQACLGGWQYVENAAGQPDFDKPETEHYSETNSAVLSDQVADIFCGNFVGEIPESGVPKGASVKFNWRFSYEDQPVIDIDPLESEEPVVEELNNLPDDGIIAGTGQVSNW